ncbi:MAG TPA: hypothetical protein VM510_15570, partial [Caulifigura sp.]|nr:hypothetical protein [Caulifigura sp.]
HGHHERHNPFHKFLACPKELASDSNAVDGSGAGSSDGAEITGVIMRRSHLGNSQAGAGSVVG